MKQNANQFNCMKSAIPRSQRCFENLEKGQHWGLLIIFFINTLLLAYSDLKTIFLGGHTQGSSEVTPGCSQE